MSAFEVHDTDSAPAAAQPLLANSQQLYGGMIPNIHGVMAEAPALLEAYQQLNAVFEKTSLTSVERNIVWLAINRENECTYCMAAHSAVALHAGVSAEDVDALRDGAQLSNGKHEALHRFTVTMVQKRGWASEADIAKLLDHGYTRQTVLEVILAIGMKTLSNYTNHVAHTPVDRAFEKYAWQKASG